MDLQVEIIELVNLQKTEIELFLNSQPQTLLYTSYSYLKMLEDFLSCEIIVLLAKSENKIVGYLPLAFRRNQEISICNSLPFYGSNGSMIVSLENADEIRRRLIDRFYDLIQQKNCGAYTLISNPLDTEGDEWLKNNIRHNLLDERIGQITHFPSHLENLEQNLLSSFEDPRPRNIRKAIKENVKVYALNSKECIDFLYQTHYDNITAINGIAKEKRFFDLIPKHFTNNDYKIYIAELNGEKIAALLLFYYNKTVEYFTPAVVEKYRNLQPTALLIYEAMIDACKLNYTNWNWGGTWLSQGGVYDFKKKWGTTDYKYFYYTNIIDNKLFYYKKEDLLDKFPYFFVLPFNKLKND